jgi:voltage-gated potassium channel
MAGLGKTQEAFDRFCRASEIPLTVLALLWLPVLVVPFVVHLSPAVTETFNAIDYFVWAVFVVEYLVRFYLAPLRRIFFNHHLVDLAVIVLPMLRPLRALRLARFLNLGRAGAVLLEGLSRARDVLTHKSLHFVLLSVLGIVFTCSALELVFERQAPASTIHNYGNALWWAIVTVTTVGYGNQYPVSAAGKGIAVVLMLVGIGLIGVLTATVASFFVQQSAEQEKTELLARLERIETMLTNRLADQVRTDNQDSSTRDSRTLGAAEES